MKDLITLKYFANIRLPTEKAHGAQIMNMCEAFADAGCTVELIVPSRQTTIKKDPFDYYAIHKNFKITYLPTIDLIRAGKVGFALQTFRYLLQGCRIAKKSSPNDILYTRDAVVAYAFSFLPAKFFWEPHLPSKHWMVKRILKKAAGIIPITHGLDNYLRGIMPAFNSCVSPDAVSEAFINRSYDKARARQKLGIPQNSKVVMYLGLLDEWKGYQMLCKISSGLKSEDVTVVIAGGREEQLMLLRKQYPEVLFIGQTPYAELPENQAAADVLVIPNIPHSKISSEYTSPLKLFAHMASDLPVVASDLPSLREIANDREVFFFVPDSEGANLKEKILYVLANPDEAIKKAVLAKQKVAEYTWSNRAANIVTFLKRIVLFTDSR